LPARPGCMMMRASCDGSAHRWKPATMSIFDNNRELLDRFRRGDRGALAEVYEHYVDDVALLARRGFTIEAAGHAYIRGADLEGEHELIQETFVKAFSDSARASFDGLRPYRPFLLRITKNLMIDRFRANRRPGALTGADNLDELLDASLDLTITPEPEEDLHWSALSEATAVFLATLDTESREIIRLRFEAELSQDAVADQLGCTRRRVRTVERRVHVQLKRHLKHLRPTRARRERRFFGRFVPALRRGKAS
jgi:RNA polymerase sigma factor (sigma-70 family)